MKTLLIATALKYFISNKDQNSCTVRSSARSSRDLEDVIDFGDVCALYSKSIF